ncbi:4'-phosphopantetheinyl transferase superfamily protein [Paenibacillus sp. N1-5-1-14]|uniref:4'-phosphopantetheinyl transferase family protein n=1 Tax=Paenibacillus radicibacter TaxID=2972488 RepID=UPI002159931E|nr:4'-phosphopantetheinyl transferase superfamily protein [Paenibacillus radicibacter]MCR8644649.1 4'-phosphopantetheinyl transferase superfamily protein [Paenibacillus radicibacter]
MLSSNLIEINKQLEIDADLVLSPAEYEIYRNITNESRKNEYLVGRYAIKRNIADNMPAYDLPFTSVTIDYGALRYPIIKDNLIEVGLSHSKQYVLSVIYSKDHIVGVDIETIRYEIPIEEMLSSDELQLVANYGNRPEFAYMFFSCKEALGKALKMGLLADYSIYEVSGMDCEMLHGTEVFRLHFRRFPFLIGYSFMKSEKEICSLVVPKKMDIEHIILELIAS